MDIFRIWGYFKPIERRFLLIFTAIPTIEELVGSMMLHEQPSGGKWDKNSELASYILAPDKESPLWEVNSSIIYYWTYDGSEKNTDKAYIIVYDGNVYTRNKFTKINSIGFRAVRTENGM